MSETPPLGFSEIFKHFLEYKDILKVITVASCDLSGNPNSAPKLLVDVVLPNHVYFLDYRYNKTYKNLEVNDRLSLSFMDERAFQGYRLTGLCRPLTDAKELGKARAIWEKRVERYVVDRIVERIKGHYSARTAEGDLPQDFVIMDFCATEAAVVKPDRVLLAQYNIMGHPEA